MGPEPAERRRRHTSGDLHRSGTRCAAPRSVCRNLLVRSLQQLTIHCCYMQLPASIPMDAPTPTLLEYIFSLNNSYFDCVVNSVVQAR